MSDPTQPPTPVSSGTSAIAIFTTLLMSGLFLLKGNTINVECVGCLYDPNSPAASVVKSTPAVVTETVTKGPRAVGVEYDCNQIALRAFANPPTSPTISGDMLENPGRLIPVLTKLSSDQRQYIYEYEKHVTEMINRHNTLCN